MLAKIFAIFLGIIGFVTVVAVNFPGRPVPITPTNTPVIEKTATSTVVVNTTNTKSSALVATTSTTTLPARTTPKKPPAPKTVLKPAVTATTPSILVSATTSPDASVGTPSPSAGIGVPPVDFSALNQKTRSAVVNILCTSQTGGFFEPLSASGVIIDPRGIILTNAHVGQFILLRNYREKNSLTCIARTSSPATPTYTLKLLYISPQWIQDNYKNLTTQNPTGTGENDFALLEIAGSTNPDITLPTSFPNLTIDNNEDDIKTGNPVLIAGYPAGFLGGIAIQRDLYMISSLVNTGQLFTFKTGTVDIFSLGGNPLAQHGSSGGAVVGTGGKLLGIIVTSTDATDTANRNLNAISIAHINRSLAAETSLTLDSLFASDLENFSAQFDAKVLPGLKSLLFNQLDSSNY